MFTQSFAFMGGIYPNAQEEKEFFVSNIWTKLYYYVMLIKHFIFSLRFGIEFEDPFKLLVQHDEDLTIVSVFPELQPRADKFPKTFKFVGCCIKENVRKTEITNPKLKEMLNLFEPVNPIESNKTSNKDGIKLIYASLGTVFNTNKEVYEKIVESLKKLDSDKIKAIVSLGKDAYDYIENKIKTEGYKVPDNILLLVSAPQIDILERASLFITHNGMNSTSEAIHYAVPMVCLPLNVDQPLVAIRVCDDLNLGVRFSISNLTVEMLVDGINQVLREKGYLERSIEFSKISRKYNGSKNSADEVVAYLKNLDKKNK